MSPILESSPEASQADWPFSRLAILALWPDHTMVPVTEIDILKSAIPEGAVKVGLLEDAARLCGRLDLVPYLV
jgi:hypothetical protein